MPWRPRPSNALDPDQAAADAARRQQITTALNAAVAAARRPSAPRQEEEARRQRIEAGIMFCPVDGPVDFIDSWDSPARAAARTRAST